MKIDYYFKTFVGNYRSMNQDAVTFLKNKTKQYLGIVCDGLGGHKGGEIASSMAINLMSNAFKKTNFTILTSDKQIYEWLNQTIYTIQEQMQRYGEEHQEASDMGTTMVLILFANNKVYCVNIGDSRIYSYCKDNLVQLTTDQNFLNLHDQEYQEDKSNSINYSQAYWKALTSALGTMKTMRIDIFHENITQDPKYFMLTSDGVHDFLEPQEITQILKQKNSLRKKTKLLLKQSLMNMSTDNVTVLLIYLY